MYIFSVLKNFIEPSILNLDLYHDKTEVKGVHFCLVLELVPVLIS